MIKLVFTLALQLTLYIAFSQSQASLNASSQSPVTKLPALDKSPLDMAYFPTDYPMQKTQNKTTALPLMRVIYSRPQKDNRVIFGELIEFDKVWRLGANEATEIEFFRDASIGGKKSLKGVIHYTPFQHLNSGRSSSTGTPIPGELLYMTRKKMSSGRM